MRAEDIISAVGGLDESFIAPAAADMLSDGKRRVPKTFKLFAIAAAAVLATVLLLAAGLNIGRPSDPAGRPAVTQRVNPDDPGIEPGHPGTEQTPAVIPESETDTDKADDTTQTDSSAPADTEPVVTEPAWVPTESAYVDPEPATEPIATEPVVTEPVVTEPQDPTMEPDDTEPKPATDPELGPATEPGPQGPTTTEESSQKPPTPPESSHKQEPEPPPDTSAEPATTGPRESTSEPDVPDPPAVGISASDLCVYLYRELGTLDPSGGSSFSGHDPGGSSLSEISEAYLWFLRAFNISPASIMGQNPDPGGGNITKAQLAFVLDSLFTTLDVEPPAVRDWPGFDDVAEGQWYTERVVRMYCAEFVDPRDETVFGINDPVKSAEGETAVHRFAEFIRAEEISLPGE